VINLTVVLAVFDLGIDNANPMAKERRQITAGDIDNNLLTGLQINTVANENFVEGTFVNIIADNSITQNNLNKAIMSITLSSYL
jgi:hypothetical protein